jgi:hypothetical protein
MNTRACLLLFCTALATGPVSAQEKLGRLFFTPAERAALDAQRKLAGEMANRPAKKDTASPKAPPPKMLTLNGVLRRSDGETTIWVNGQAVHERFRDVDVMPGSISREAVAVQLPGSGRRVKLKVGQSVDSMTGVVEENYRRSPEPEEAADAVPDAEARKPEEPRRAAEATVKPRRKVGAGDDYYPPPAAEPAKPPAQSGSATDDGMQEYR